jgi:uncharacterized protein HemY
VRQNPDYGLAYYHLGESYRRNGQFSEATDILRGGRKLASATNDASLSSLIDAALEKTTQKDNQP